MIIQKYQFYGIKSIFVIGLVYTTRGKSLILGETYKRFEVFCQNDVVILIGN